MKTFRQLREALDKANPEVAGLKPRAQGEIDFADAHTREVKDYPVSSKGDKTKETEHQPNNGDRGPIKQGTSDLKDQSGFKGNKTPMTRADKTQGDMKPVRQSPSAVQPFKESLFINQPTINESEENIVYIDLLNGDSIEINQDTWDALHQVYENLNTGNREVFRAAVNESVDSFEKILDFVVETLGDE